MYPKTTVTPGGITDRLLSDYPNMYGDMSAGSGLNSMLRDEDHARDFLKRHQDKLLFGSDCSDRKAGSADCLGVEDPGRHPAPRAGQEDRAQDTVRERVEADGYLRIPLPPAFSTMIRGYCSRPTRRGVDERLLAYLRRHSDPVGRR